MSKIHVLAIVGMGRSGSTLLSRILGQTEHFMSCGEVHQIWDGIERDYLCGCGTQLSKCVFWNAVLDEAFGGIHNVNGREWSRLKASVDRVTAVPALLFPRIRSRQHHRNLQRHLQRMEQLYTAIHCVTGGKTIVDASKYPAYFMLLRQLPDVELHLLHLVRDSRAVAYSLSQRKKKAYARLFQEDNAMPVHNIIRGTLKWNVRNLSVSLLRKGALTYRLLRYEDLVRHPRTVVQDIVQHLHEDCSIEEYLTDRGVILSDTEHGIAGNIAARGKTGFIPIRQHREWEQELGVLRQCVITALSWPLLRRYNYNLMR